MNRLFTDGGLNMFDNNESISHLIKRAINLGWVSDKPDKIFMCPPLNP